MSTTLTTLPLDARILTLRGQRVMVDADLAELYGVPTRRLNEQVKRNAGRFPADFMFRLTASEKAEVVATCDHLRKLKFSRAMPLAFTEHGAIQAASVLASAQAVKMGIYVVRAFVQMRQACAVHADLAHRLAELEQRTAQLESGHDEFSTNTRAQLQLLLDAVRELTMPPVPPKRPIGFVVPQEKKTTTHSRKG